METAIWVIEGALTGAFFMAGLLKVILPKNRLDEQLSWARDFTPGMVQFIGTCEILGAIGLFLPRYLNILPFLTPVAGFLLARIDDSGRQGALLSKRIH